VGPECLFLKYTAHINFNGGIFSGKLNFSAGYIVLAFDLHGIHCLLLNVDYIIHY
jgi:hypothetical protein